MCSARNARNKLGERLLLLPAQAGGGLVQHQQHRIGRQRPRDLKQPLIAERQVSGQFERPVAQADAAELGERFLARPRLFAAIEPQRAGKKTGAGSRIGAEQHIVEQRHARADAHVLEGAGDAGAGDVAWRQPADLAVLRNECGRRRGAALRSAG